MKKIKFTYKVGENQFTAIFDNSHLYEFLKGLKVDLVTYIANNPFLVKTEVINDANKTVTY